MKKGILILIAFLALFGCNKKCETNNTFLLQIINGSEKSCEVEFVELKYTITMQAKEQREIECPAGSLKLNISRTNDNPTNSNDWTPTKTVTEKNVTGYSCDKKQVII
ncbi:hypothetical protein TRIP_D300113 [uncultured Paludibacter sp.]|nr:hypothetical protein TRIP_D300113 [uncultured Paludibacter sp.]